MNEIYLSIIVCTYNRATLLFRCLDSLKKQTLTQSLYEVIIVNNNSKDETQKISNKFVSQNPNFRVISEPTISLSLARNRGWKEARGEYIAYIDDDAIASPNWCEKILEAFLNVQPTPIAVGGKITPWYDEPPPDWFSDGLETRTWGEEACFLKRSNAEYGFSGSNMAFPKWILKKYGGFSDNFGMIGDKIRLGEDADFFHRLYKSGKRRFWYDPKIQVKHFTSKKHFLISYRLNRAYVAGSSHAAMDNVSPRFSDFIISILSIPYAATNEIIRLIDSGYSRSKIIKSTQRVTHQIGYLIGIIQKLLTR